jgi:predicted aspartyl protease
MSFSFNPAFGLVIVQAKLFGPSGIATLNLALDTGASRTLLNEDILISVGYDLADAVGHSSMTTGSKVESVALICIDKIIALGQEHTAMIVVSHTLPPSASVDGLLGLDFLRGLNLNVDFRNGQITLS